MINPEHIALVSKLEDVIINHTKFSTALNGILECLEKSKYYKNPVGCILTAEGGFGKSTIGEILHMKFPRQVTMENNHHMQIVPFLTSSIPSSTTIKGLASELLESLGDPNPGAGTCYEITNRLCNLLIICKTQLIYLDEFNHLFKVSRNSAAINREVADWIKTLINKTGVCICLVGVPGFSQYFLKDTQYAGRFCYHFEITKLKTVNKNNGGELEGFFKEMQSNIERYMGIEFIPGFDTYPFYDQLYLASAGIPKFIKLLTKDALLNYLDGDHDGKLASYHFSRAWQKGSTKGVCLTNKDPFTINSNEITEYLTGIK
jgi:hypothetical protein